MPGMMPARNRRPTDVSVASADAAQIVVSTHRGVYTSIDGGTTWTLVADNLPGHIEAGPLVREMLVLHALLVKV